MSVEPDSEVPVLLAGVRDEFVTRPWMSPGRYWPGHPEILGGRDLEAGGTWLAAHPADRRVAALLNGRGPAAPPETRRSRGELPLRAAAEGDLPPVDPRVYDPFHLLIAGLDGVRLWSWDGESLAEEKLPRGVHVLGNDGWERGDDDPRAAWFRPLFAAAPRPVWTSDCDSPERFWGEWLTLASGGGLAVDDPRALIVNRRLPDRRVYASLSVTLVALSAEGLRYDFCPRPDEPSTWHRVDTTG
ncbi:NRDE family protein [Microbispora oryzae]|uniref:NRDE family protein n=1 Tax=Microbispora oryzae TaxID=2806554 RepID=UPI0027DDF78D|nr:NRDE family protein [Microbispora oryzae]